MVIKVTIKGAKGAKKQLTDIEKSIIVNAENELLKSVYILERDLVKGSPVDTGRYRLGWRIIKISKYSYEIRNSVEYAVHLIFGTVYRGILHDVRGVVRYWKAHTYTKALASVIKK